jgi:transcriptional regulator with XRE-family HTH domain
VISPLVRRRRLAAELRKLREDAGLTAEQLAKRIGQSRMKISRLENGNGRPSVADVIKVLDALGVTGDPWHALRQMASDAAERGWWEDYGEHMGERQRVYADLEYGAVEVREYQNFVVPGLLQTPEYTRARAELARLQARLPDAPNLDRAVDAKIARQRVLRRPDGPTYEAILDEVVFRRAAAAPDVMRAQLKHLVHLAAEDGRIAVRVLPLSAFIPDYWLPRSPFSVYSYRDPGDPVVAAVDTEMADLVYTDPHEIAPYTELFDRLRCAALSIPDSIDFLAKAADQVDSYKKEER